MSNENDDRTYVTVNNTEIPLPEFTGRRLRMTNLVNTQCDELISPEVQALPVPPPVKGIEESRNSILLHIASLQCYTDGVNALRADKED